MTELDTSFTDWLGIASSLSVGARDLALGTSLDDLPAPASYHGRRVDQFEAFSRTLLLESIRSRAAQEGLDVRYLEALDDCAWFPRPERFSKAAVDAASVSLALWIYPDAWQKLSTKGRERLIGYLTSCLPIAGRAKNNWRLFAIPIAGFLHHVTGNADMKLQADSALGRCEELYRGGGWYSDGGDRTFDYYNSFSFHFYPPLCAWLSGDSNLQHRYNSRLEQFLPELARLYSSDGRPILFGRSLTYRNAISAPISVAGLVLPTTPELLGLRRLRTQHMNHLLNGGMITGGIVLPGWYEKNEHLVDNYSGPLASYWLAKGFVDLLASPQSEYWSNAAPAGVLPPSDRAERFATPNWIALESSSDGSKRLINHGSYDRTAIDVNRTPDCPQYDRLTYDTRTVHGGSGPFRTCQFTITVASRVHVPGRLTATGGSENTLWSVAQMLPVRHRRRTRIGRFVSRRWRHWVDRHLIAVVRASHARASWDIHAVRVPAHPNLDRVDFAGWPVEHHTESPPPLRVLLSPDPSSTTVVDGFDIGHRRIKFETASFAANPEDATVVVVASSAQPLLPTSPSPSSAAIEGDVVSIEWSDGITTSMRLPARSTGSSESRV